MYDVHNGLSKGGKFFGSGYPFLSFKTVFNNYFLPPVLPDLVQSDEKEQRGFDIKRGDVFITRTSETPEELGMSSVALKDYPFATYNGFTKRLRPKDTSVIYPEFIGYYLRSTKFRVLFYGLASSMSTRASLANGDLLGMRVFLPSFETQEKIAMILKSLDNKIELNKRINDNFVIEGFFEVLLVWMLTTPINDNLEQQAQALFKSWFVDFEPFRNQPFVESELGMIPQGWQVGTLAEITQQKSEKVGQQEDVKVLSPVTTGKLMLSEEYFTKQVFSESIAKYKVVEIGDFAYNPARVNIGSIGRNEYGFRGCVSPVYIVFSCKDGYDYFFDLFRKTEKFQTEVKARAIGGVRQSLNYTDFGFIQTVIAPTDVMKKFNPFYEKIQAAQKHLEEENSRLSSLRDALLPRLMSGELSVKEIVNM